MRNLNKKNIPLNLLLGMVITTIVFHVSIVVKIIPYEITWGGRLQSVEEMYVFETISIGINLFLSFLLLMKGGFIKLYFKEKVIHFFLWFFLFVFVLNTIGNLFAKTNFEKMFSILTLAFAILIWLVIKPKKVR